jgi:pimeloyl-ACP methyl ester carboxylesterase
MICHLGEMDVYHEDYGTGIPILMLHGFQIDHRVLTGSMEPIFKAQSAGYRRLYPDLPGMGQTKSPPWIKSSDDILNVVMQFIEKTISDEPFLVVGSSYGAYLARALCAKIRPRILGVCLIVPMIIPDPQKRSLPKRLLLEEDPRLWKTMTPEEAKEFKNMAVVATKQTWARYRVDIVPALQLGDKRLLEKIFKEGYACSWDVDRVPEPYPFPALILTGRFDDSVGYRDAWQILDNFPRGTFAVLDKAGHCLEAEQEHLFAVLVKEWLERCKLNQAQ